LLDEYSERPAVRSDVMHYEHQHVIGRTKLEQGRAQHGPAREIKWTLRFGYAEAQHRRLSIACWHGGQARDIHSPSARIRDGCARLSTTLLERGAQRVVPLDDLAQAFFKCAAIQV